MKRTTIILIYSIAILFMSGNILAQNKSIIRGKVIDEETNDPVIGATIVERDAQNRIINGTIADVNGNYVLEVSNSKDSISVSFVGYETTVFTIGSRSSMDIELSPKAIGLEEVRITAKSTAKDLLTGISEIDKTSSSTRIDMSELKGMSTVSVDDALQGQVSGLDIVAASGNPGSGSRIVIRGMGSLGNANPLIVVDGIPQDIRVEPDFNFQAADEQDLGNLVNIAPQDIKSVEVLKDAAATATWGSKGADGVLIINTHQGKKSQSISFDYQYKIDANIQSPPVPMLNGDEYITMQLEEFHNSKGIFEVPPQIAYDREYIDFYNYSQNTDWIREITRDSYTHDHFLRMSGGSDNTTYYTSINYQKNYGTTTNNAFRRLSLRANIDYELSSKIRFTTNFNYSNTDREGNPSISGYNVRTMAYIKAPNMAIWEHDANGNLTGEYFIPIESYQGRGSEYFNPVAVADYGKNDRINDQIENSFILFYDIADWIMFKQTVSFSFINTKNNSFIPYNAIGADWLEGSINSASEGNSLDSRLLSRSQLFFTPFVKSRNHKLTAVAMAVAEQKKNDWMSIRSSKSPKVTIEDPAANPVISSISSGSSESRLFGVLGSANYVFKNRYLLTANVRADADSRFGTSNRWGLFPSISAGWRFMMEPFASGVKFIDDISKLRFSVGQSGKAPSSAYARFAQYQSQTQYRDEPAIRPDQIQLDNLKWQTVTQWNIGLELSFLKGRASLTTDVYLKRTSDLLWSNYSIPTSSGFSQLEYFNGGELENKGWELLVQGTVIQRDNFRTSLNFNISQNINSFLEFPDNFNEERSVSIGNGEYPRKAEIGKPIGSFYGFHYLGVWPSDEAVIAKDPEGNILVDGNGDPMPLTYKESYEFQGGDAIYEDFNHDGTIDILDAVYIGDSSPDFTGGFGVNAGYKRISASVFFHYRLGFDIVNRIAISTQGMSNRNNQSKAVLHRWRRQGQDEPDILPRAYMDHPANNLGSDRYVERGDFLRLNNVNIRYSFRPQVANRLGLKSLEVAFLMRKIMTFTYYTGQDPEIGQVGDDPFWMGEDRARTPVPKIYSVSLSLGF